MDVPKTLAKAIKGVYDACPPNHYVTVTVSTVRQKDDGRYFAVANATTNLPGAGADHPTAFSLRNSARLFLDKTSSYAIAVHPMEHDSTLHELVSQLCRATLRVEFWYTLLKSSL